MAKNSKLSKLRCIIKRWNSAGRNSRCAGGGVAEQTGNSPEEDAWRSESFHGDEIPIGFHPVFVGKSRRRYLVSSDLVHRPLFQTLIDRSGGGGGGHVVECEVVLFEHLLWMLENADPQPESLDELVDFYSC